MYEGEVAKLFCTGVIRGYSMVLKRVIFWTSILFLLGIRVGTYRVICDFSTAFFFDQDFKTPQIQLYFSTICLS